MDLKAAMHSIVDAFCEIPSEGGVLLEVSEDDDYFDEGSPGPIWFAMKSDTLFIGVTFNSNEFLSEKTEPDAVNAVRRALEPFLTRHRAVLHRWTLDPVLAADPFVINILLQPALRGRTLQDLYEIGEGVLALLAALQGATLTREATLDLLRAGRAEILIGQPEGPWLDVKSAHYDLTRVGGKVSLAQSVARFANAEHGGIVVVGMKGKKVPGGEEIREICPLPDDRGVLRKYQSALENHLYPPPDYLDIECVTVKEGILILLHVPPQPEELKPFLVHGAVVEGATEGAFISIVRRRGESSIPITAPAIHATLAAGRALLRRGELPTGSPADP
ncbi:ATP-binding protein [Streptomyces sp. DSM 41527]|uniref:ATP-binding protein n=1 Tax=Streptomyces mooreae TaxID=3075523 RepID=A0ABU2TDS0_9ACTN|nr:ATP-binding protein [Streptomyces sp. DSM 41527]MDT0459062.1 ATP-binding protein [Streptomyces sp. DSM 41527]